MSNDVNMSNKIDIFLQINLFNNSNSRKDRTNWIDPDFWIEFTVRAFLDGGLQSGAAR